MTLRKILTSKPERRDRYGLAVFATILAYSLVGILTLAFLSWATGGLGAILGDSEQRKSENNIRTIFESSRIAYTAPVQTGLAPTFDDYAGESFCQRLNGLINGPIEVGAFRAAGPDGINAPSSLPSNTTDADCVNGGGDIFVAGSTITADNLFNDATSTSSSALIMYPNPSAEVPVMSVAAFFGEDTQKRVLCFRKSMSGTVSKFGGWYASPPDGGTSAFPLTDCFSGATITDGALDTPNARIGADSVEEALGN